MMNLDDEVWNIQSQNDFVKFVRALIGDFKNHKDEWENRDIEAYLDAVAAWVEDGGLMGPKGESMSHQSDWRVFGRILLSGKYYE